MIGPAVSASLQAAFFKPFSNLGTAGGTRKTQGTRNEIKMFSHGEMRPQGEILEDEAHEAAPAACRATGELVAGQGEVAIPEDEPGEQEQ